MRTDKENTERINKVVRYIEQAIDKEMSLNELAEIACFSPYHFQRVFKEIAGETPKQFIKRLRLEEAARIISFHPEQNILEVAVQLGFQSLEAFSRAFKDYYLVSPDNYRKRSEIERINISQYPYLDKKTLEEPEFEISFASDKAEFQSLEVNIISRPMQKAVYLQTTLHAPTPIKDSFSRIKQWSQAREIINSETILFGLIKDYPVFTSLDKCRFLTCVSVNAETTTSGLVSYLELPASKYAFFEVSGPLSNIIKASSFIVHSWLGESGYKLKLDPILLQPLNDPSEIHFNKNRYRVYIPVQSQ